MIPILMTVFAIGGTTFGMAEESLAFYVLIITVMIAAGYDSLVGASILLLGCGIGVLGSTINPFATGIASEFAGVSIDEGLIGRLVILVIGTAIGDLLRDALCREGQGRSDEVARRRGRRPTETAAETGGEASEAHGVDDRTRRRPSSILFFLAFVVMIFGVIPWEDLGIGVPTLCWWFPEMTASFLLFAILIGVVARMGESDFTSTFVDGARDLLGVALIIGIARGITVIMNNGLITDTVLNAAEQVGRRPRRRRVHQPDVRPVPAAVVPDPVLVRAGDRRDADHGAARELRRRPAAAGRHRLPERERAGEPRHADVGRRDGRSGHRQGRLRDVAQVRVARS